MGKRRRQLPSNWQIYVRPRGLAPAQVRMMVWTGLLLGLIVLQALRLLAAAPPFPESLALERRPIEAPDPYAESRRSRAILEAQEDQPPSNSVGDGASVVQVSGPVRVIDGDTFVYGGERIRIADIDTPEVHGRCPYETELAARATARMRGLLAAGPFELHPLSNGREVDRYGRKLRIVTRGGQSLGDMLVAVGLARTWIGRREPWCS